MRENISTAAEGAERKEFAEREIKQLTADQVLMDEKMNEIWMRQVQRDPSRFLSIKFHMQLQRKEGNNAP